MLRLAGCSSGTGVCARGGWRRGVGGGKNPSDRRFARSPFRESFGVLSKAPIRGASRLFWRGECPKTKFGARGVTTYGGTKYKKALYAACDDCENRVFGQPEGCSLRAPRPASGCAVLLECPASVHACLFSFGRKKEAACGMLRSCSAWSESPFVGSLAF